MFRERQLQVLFENFGRCGPVGRVHFPAQQKESGQNNLSHCVINLRNSKTKARGRYSDRGIYKRPGGLMGGAVGFTEGAHAAKFGAVNPVQQGDNGRRGIPDS